ETANSSNRNGNVSAYSEYSHPCRKGRGIPLTLRKFLQRRGETQHASPSAANEFRAAQCTSTLVMKSSALGSFDWPSQNTACLRTAGFLLFLATSMSLGTPS